MTHEDPTVPCKWCTTPTIMRGTKMCDYCWELEWRIRTTPTLAQRMLAAQPTNKEQKHG